MSDLGLRALDLARAALAAGVREQPPGSNRGPEVDAYLRGCVRHGKRLGVLGVAWCAAMSSAMVWRAAHGDDAERLALGWSPSYVDDPPVGWRAAVSELVTDARATATWHDIAELSDDAHPEVGDLLVMGRAGHDPRRGGEGHVAFVDEVAEGGWYAIGGNEDSAVRRTLRTLADRDEPVLGWIST